MMKLRSLVFLRSGLFAAALFGMSLPGLAFAQAQVPPRTSGSAASPGVAPAQLPRTGDDAANDSAAALPAVLLGSGALVAGLIVRRRSQRRPLP